MSLRALEGAPHGGGNVHHGPARRVSMQYEDLDQQDETYLVGM